VHCYSNAYRNYWTDGTLLWLVATDCCYVVDLARYLVIQHDASVPFTRSLVYLPWCSSNAFAQTNTDTLIAIALVGPVIVFVVVVD